MGQGMRMALKGSTPSAHARLKYITRQGAYAKGIDGPRTDLAESGSGNLPNWAGDAAQFWQGADQFERANARRCVELELNLPPELSLDQQRQVVEAYAERLLGAERLPHTWAIHDSGGGNPHCHLMFQERGLDGIDRPDAQAWFKRANAAHPERGGAMKSRSITGAAWTMHARVTWAEAVNNGLRAAGHAPRFDHRSKVVQRDDALRNGNLRCAAALGTLTERHEGATVHGMRRRVERGEVELTALPDYAQQLIQQNDRARAYNNELRDWARTAPDAELAERLAPELADLAELLAEENPGAHVTAFELHQVHGEALVMNGVFDGERAKKAHLEAEQRRRQQQVAEERVRQLEAEALNLRRAAFVAVLTELAQLSAALELGSIPKLEVFRTLVNDWLRAPDSCPHPIAKLRNTRDQLRDKVKLQVAFDEAFDEAEKHYESMSDVGGAYSGYEEPEDLGPVHAGAESTTQQVELEPEPPAPEHKPRGPRMG